MPRAYLRDDNETIRRRLRVADVMAYGDRAPDSRGRYFCLWHDDESTGHASADVWETDDGDRLGCWSCGESIDALALLARFMPGAMRRDVEERAGQIIAATGSEPARTRPLEAVSPDRLAAELRRTTEGIRLDHDPLERFVASRDRSNTAPIDFLRAWGWVGDYRGRIVIPHWNTRDEITGLRYRLPPRWEKGARERSQFRQLYGVWRFRYDSPDVWICEGETDTTWAAFNLEPLGVSVIGVSSASQPVRPDELELLRGRNVYLAFDGDNPGRRAVARWNTALTGVAANLSILDIEPGSDLCSMGESPADVWRKRA